jgi:probable phosphoglycerate mutase
VVLIRHGEAVCNAEGIVGGERGCGGLTDLGRAQARSLAQRLAHSGEFDDAVALYSSTLPRALETTAIIHESLPSDLAVRERFDLRELDPGEADGLRWDAYVERYGVPDWDRDPGAAIAPGGESWLDLYHRTRTVLSELAATHDG